MADINQMVAAYIQLRDQKKQIQDRHKEELETTIAKMAIVEAGLLDMLNTTGVESARTDAGTAYKNTRVKARVENREAFFGFVKDNDLYHMLSSAVSDPAIREFIEANGEAPPGVGINTVVTINVRR